MSYTFNNDRRYSREIIMLLTMVEFQKGLGKVNFEGIFVAMKYTYIQSGISLHS